MLHCIKFTGTPRHTDLASTRSEWTYAMSAHFADSDFNQRLPRLSYIDAKWEEPELRQQARPAPARRGLAAWLAGRLTSLRTWVRDNQAAGELAGMSDRELHDIGLTRSDLVRVFNPELNQDLRQRGERF
jgi:uncharacterized protein YjiS (DUF1127 family)